MKLKRGPIGAVFTDLDGTLLEPDGTLCRAARDAIARLRQLGIPVVPMTSKTQDELRAWLGEIDAGGMGSFENGAGILGPDGSEVSPSAVPVAELAARLGEIAARGALPLRALPDLADAELHELTGLGPEEMEMARRRQFDLPFVAPPGTEGALSKEVGIHAGLRLTRGGVFWHLSGPHDKQDAFVRLREKYLIPGPVVALGDAANDTGFLALADVPVIVPRAEGVDKLLAAALPGGVRVAPLAGGQGWAMVIGSLLGG